MKKRALLLSAMLAATLATSVTAQGAGAGGRARSGGAGGAAAGATGTRELIGSGTVRSARVGTAPVGGGFASRQCGQTTNLGIGTFHCQGGNCRIMSLYAYNDDGTYRGGSPDGPLDPTDWEFTVEPSLWQIHPQGVAAGRVLEGDFLVAVNGAPVTTREATSALARMQAGRPLTLTLRRSGTLIETAIVPSAVCPDGMELAVSAGSGEMPFLVREARWVSLPERGDALAGAGAGSSGAAGSGGGTVRAIVTPPDGTAGSGARTGATGADGAGGAGDRWIAAARPRGGAAGAGGVGGGSATLRLTELGAVLSGAYQERAGAGDRTAMSFTGEPVISAIEQNGALARSGVQAGDVLLSVNGRPLSDPASVAALRAATRSQSMTLVIRRGGETREVVVRPQG